MKVSVVITTYKRPHYLKEAVESVLAQDFKDFELIIVNDDSEPEEAEKIIQFYHDSRIIFVKNEKNLGGAKSLNVGLKTAKGEYIAILDDDDIWVSSDKLKKQVYFLDNNPDYVIVGTNSFTVEGDDDKKISEPVKDYIKTEDAKKMLFSGTFFPHSSVLYRRKEALLAGGYDEKLPRSKDLDLYFRITDFGKFGFLPECLVKHREVVSKERNIIKTRYVDLIFHKKVLWKYRTHSVYFWVSFLRAYLRSLVFFSFLVFPPPYYIYRKCRYGNFLGTRK